MGNLLSHQPDEFLQLYVYIVSVVCVVGPEAVLAVYPNDERPDQTAGARYDLEESVRLLGLGVFPDGLMIILLQRKSMMILYTYLFMN